MGEMMARNTARTFPGCAAYLPDVGHIVQRQNVVRRDLTEQRLHRSTQERSAAASAYSTLVRCLSTKLSTNHSSVVRQAVDTHQLFPHGWLDGVSAAARQQRGIDAQRAQHRHAVLRRLGLLLAHDAQHRHQADVHHAEVAGAHFELKLPQRLHCFRTDSAAEQPPEPIVALQRSTTACGAASLQ